MQLSNTSDNTYDNPSTNKDNLENKISKKLTSIPEYLDDPKFRKSVGADKPSGANVVIGNFSVYLKPGRSALESTFKLS